jgi:hypothetical protein
MVVFQVRLNGKRICTAGAEDLAVLTACVTANGKLGSKAAPARPGDTKAEVFYHVGGLTARPDQEKDMHLNWQSVEPLKVGDVIQVKVLMAERADRPKSRKKAVRKLG